MKKKILIIALVCILAGVAAFYIVKVNKMYPQGSVTEYELNESVELNGYSASVSSYKVMSIEDFLNEYGIDKRKDISDEQDDLYVMVAECTLDITGEMKGFPYADIRLASGAFSQGISNDYIRETARVTGKSATYISSSGKQTLNGVQAVAYSRIRYTSGGDYKRTERMRDVIEAMLKKLQTKSIGEINTLLDNILPKIYTNISTGSIISEIPSITKYKITDSIGWPYNTKGKTMTLWYGIPITLESNVVQLHQELFGESDYKVSDTVKEISNKIIEKTGYTN